MREAPRVYLAGKIAKNDWRHDLFPIRGMSERDDMLERDGLIYCGPWFMNCDHGCWHGESQHGLRATGGTDFFPQDKDAYGSDPYSPPGGDAPYDEVRERRLEVVFECQRWMSRANAVLAWIDSPDAYGTLHELGWAEAHDIPTFVAFATNELRREMWFAEASAQLGSGLFVDHNHAWRVFEKVVHRVIEAPHYNLRLR